MLVNGRMREIEGERLTRDEDARDRDRDGRERESEGGRKIESERFRRNTYMHEKPLR